MNPLSSISYLSTRFVWFSSVNTWSVADTGLKKYFLMCSLNGALERSKTVSRLEPLARLIMSPRVMEEKRTLKMLRVVAGGVLESGLQPPSSSSSSPNRGTSPRRLVSGWFSLWSLAFAESIRLRASRMMVLTVAADALEPVVCCPLCWPGGSSPPSSWSTLNKLPNVDKVPEWK